MITRLLAACTIGTARLVTGVRCNWQGCLPEPKPRIYFANHRSHGDFVLIWSVLPSALRQQTRPVAAADYWGRGGLRQFIGERVFNAVLIEREVATRDRRSGRAAWRPRSTPASSLILFPEGTRNTSAELLLPFKSGLLPPRPRRPDVELVPVWIENLNARHAEGRVHPGAAAVHGHLRRAARCSRPGEDKARVPSSAPARRCWRSRRGAETR